MATLARALARSHPAESRALQQRFQDLQSGKQTAERAETLANSAIGAAASNDWPKAIAQLKEALDVCGECRSRAGLHKSLGLIYCRSGDLANGERELRLAMNDLPADAEILNSLEVIEKLRK
jgi:Tfp pilus assembly protein PilF